jgi:2-oxoisovalerate ferredoxin oxidoreductase beta subunit
MANAGKAKSFFAVYERKPELQHQTHYCPGCGHGIIHKMVAKAIDKLGIQDRTILISPVGCSVFAYYYFDVGNIQAAHGRAPAVAAAVKRSRPGSTVISYQGDGDLAAIGTAEIVHAANRGENISVIFVNNAIYGMTGGQMAPTTLLGQRSTTSPSGRDALHDGYPLHMSEMLACLEAPVYIERVALGDNKLIAQADKAIQRAIENQVKGLGFSLVEVLSPCPTSWKMEPVEAQRWVRDVMARVFPVQVFRDRTNQVMPRTAAIGVPVVENSAAASQLGRAQAMMVRPTWEDLRIRVAGFGGQGVLLLGEVLAEAGLDAGFEVSWLPSYGPEMRSGTSNCHVRVSCKPIDSPLVTRPNILLAMNEPSLRKFLTSVEPGGWVLFNGDAVPEGCQRPDVHMLSRNFTAEADVIGGASVGNVVMLGALIEAAHVLPLESVIAGLKRLVKNPHLFAIDRRALERGAELVEEGVNHESGTGSEDHCVLQ